VTLAGDRPADVVGRAALAAVDLALPEPDLVRGTLTDSSGGFRWRLRSGKGRIIATSGESYTTKANAKNRIEAVQPDAPAADVDDLA
jgi:uncharacterized protein YegP (UPF0339 family)